ncbi:hypothetical protein [Kutzneria chonburiensis]|nr:hypothetical protein [Kutzneria chonburiensis]
MRPQQRPVVDLGPQRLDLRRDDVRITGGLGDRGKSGERGDGHRAHAEQG